MWPSDLELVRDATIILDIDGTVTTPGSSTTEPAAAASVKRLKKHNKIYLLSNRGDHARGTLLAEELGVIYLATRHRKPNPKTLHALSRGNEALIIVGDKVLTDGLLAFFSRGMFIQVSRLTSPHDSFLDQTLHALDDVAGYIWTYLRLLRPLQWIKNILLFTPLFFAERFLDSLALQDVTAAFVAFCFVASATYIANDLFDASLDREHPHKRRRPVARGEVSRGSAVVLATFLAGGGGLLLFFTVPLALPVAIAYAGSSLLYSAFLKKIALLEILMFVWFYLARVVAGGLAAGVALSSWLILTVIFLALFLVAGKRYAEYLTGHLRPALKGYSALFLRGLLLISATLVVAFYGMWSILGAHSSLAMYSTIPLVAAVMRYLQLSLRNDAPTEYPERLIFKDRGLQICIIAWFIIVIAVFY